MLPHSLQVVAKGAPVQENSLAGSFRQRAIVHNKKLNEIRHVLSLDLSPLLNHCADEFRPTFSVKSLRLNRPKIVTAHTTAVQDSLFFWDTLAFWPAANAITPVTAVTDNQSPNFCSFGFAIKLIHSTRTRRLN